MLFTFYKYLHSIPSLEFLHSVHGYFLEPYNNEKSHKLNDKLKFTFKSEPVIIKGKCAFCIPSVPPLFPFFLFLFLLSTDLFSVTGAQGYCRGGRGGGGGGSWLGCG